MISPLVTGAHIVCYINSRMFGEVADINVVSDTPRKAVETVDWLQPTELMPGVTRTSGTMTIYRLHRAGGIEAAGMVGILAEISREKYFNVLIMDRLTNTPIFRADRCCVTNQSLRMSRGYVMSSVGFEALDWSNEVGPTT